MGAIKAGRYGSGGDRDVRAVNKAVRWFEELAALSVVRMGGSGEDPKLLMIIFGIAHGLRRCAWRLKMLGHGRWLRAVSFRNMDLVLPVDCQGHTVVFRADC